MPVRASSEPTYSSSSSAATSRGINIMPRRLIARRKSRDGSLFGGTINARGGSSKPRNSLFAVPPASDANKRNRRAGSYALLFAIITIALAWCFVSVGSVLWNNQRSGTGLRNATVRDDSRIPRMMTAAAATHSKKKGLVPVGWDRLLERAQDHIGQCKALQPGNAFTGFDTRSVLPFHNDTVASLPSFGIVNAIEKHFANPDKQHQDSWPVCQLPPENECQETQFSVVFMAYNPDRLGVTLNEIKKLLNPAAFQNLVHEIILVWNGERHVDESDTGKELLEFTKHNPVRIVYPLKMGFPNDLMNRYHPDVVQPKTKALLYYDDDGPFYSYKAIEGGFELWKRHSNAQIGAMSRQLNYSPRQEQQRREMLGAETNKKAMASDKEFVSHCTNVDDQVDYDFHFFANYDANMVLPSGSMLHSNYLCYLWHPALSEVRQFVLDHPVHPDDMTVSMVVSQLAGRAPRVYSRRLNPQDKPVAATAKKRRRLLEAEYDDDEAEEYEEEPVDWGVVPQSELQRRRSLMFSICWDCGAGMTEMKQYWAELRTEAVNSLVRYFGSLNSGSIGWCERDSQYYDASKDGRCHPLMARQGWLPWMKPDGTPKDTCP